MILDRNECNNPSLNDCHQFASCINTPGSYECSCLDGFVQVGADCIGKIFPSWVCVFNVSAATHNSLAQRIWCQPKWLIDRLRVDVPFRHGIGHWKCQWGQVLHGPSSWNTEPLVKLWHYRCCIRVTPLTFAPHSNYRFIRRFIWYTWNTIYHNSASVCVQVFSLLKFKWLSLK